MSCSSTELLTTEGCGDGAVALAAGVTSSTSGGSAVKNGRRSLAKRSSTAGCTTWSDASSGAVSGDNTKSTQVTGFDRVTRRDSHDPADDMSDLYDPFDIPPDSDLFVENMFPAAAAGELFTHVAKPGGGGGGDAKNSPRRSPKFRNNSFLSAAKSAASGFLNQSSKYEPHPPPPPHPFSVDSCSPTSVRDISLLDDSPPTEPPTQEELQRWAMARPYDLKWSLPVKASVPKADLSSLTYHTIVSPDNSKFAVVRTVKAGSRLEGILQPGYVMMSIDGRPLHTLDDPHLAASDLSTLASYSNPACSDVTNPTCYDVTNPTCYDVTNPTCYDVTNCCDVDDGHVVIFFIKPIARLKTRRPGSSCSSARSTTSSKKSASIRSGTPCSVPEMWIQSLDDEASVPNLGSQWMTHAPFVYLTVISAREPRAEESMRIRNTLLVQKVLQLTEVPSAKSWLEVSLHSAGNFQSRVIYDCADLAPRCNAAIVASKLHEAGVRHVSNTEPLTAGVPLDLVNSYLEKGNQRTVNVFLQSFSTKRTQDFFQLFISHFSVYILTFDADNFTDISILKLNEYFFKLQHYSDNNQLPSCVFLVGFTAQQHWGAANDEIVMDALGDVIHTYNLTTNQLFILNTSSSISDQDVEALRFGVLSSLVHQPQWLSNTDKAPLIPSPLSGLPYLNNYISYRDLVIRTAINMEKNGRPFVFSIQTFVQLLSPGPCPSDEETSRIIDYLSRVGCIKQVTPSTAMPTVLLYPQLLCKVLGELLGNVDSVKSTSPQSYRIFRSLGVIDSCLWNSVFRDVLCDLDLTDSMVEYHILVPVHVENLMYILPSHVKCFDSCSIHDHMIAISLQNCSKFKAFQCAVRILSDLLPYYCFNEQTFIYHSSKHGQPVRFTVREFNSLGNYFVLASSNPALGSDKFVEFLKNLIKSIIATSFPGLLYEIGRLCYSCNNTHVITSHSTCYVSNMVPQVLPLTTPAAAAALTCLSPNTSLFPSPIPSGGVYPTQRGAAAFHIQSNNFLF